MIIDFEDIICQAVKAAVASELASLSPAVSVSAFGEDADLAAHRIEINADCTGGEHIPGADYRYPAIRRCQLSFLFATPKIPAARNYISTVKCAMRHVAETAWESASPVAVALAPHRIQIHPAPQQAVHQQDELTDGGAAFITVRMEYVFAFYYHNGN